MYVYLKLKILLPDSNTDNKKDLHLYVVPVNNTLTCPTLFREPSKPVYTRNVPLRIFLKFLSWLS